MVKHLMMKMIKTLFSLATLLFAVMVQADALKDPTQPPASLYSNTNSSGSETLALPILQSVMIGPHYRAAIINGKKILLGKKYEQATLIKLNEHEAVLRNPDMTTQTLVMDYAIEKKIVSPITRKK